MKIRSRFVLSLFFYAFITSAVWASSPVVGPLLSFSGGHLLVHPAALGKELLLRASYADQTVAATSSGTLSRIVYMQRSGDRVFLMESREGHVVTNDLPSQFILAEFPIVGEGSGIGVPFLILDFNRGMSRLFTAGNWYGSDYGGRNYDPNSRSYAAEVSHSFISEARHNEPELEIRQLVQLRLMNGEYHPSYEVRYYLSPYEPNTQFLSRENPTDIRQLMYFETEPRIEQGAVSGRSRSTTNVTRWDIQKGPITYYISANTPSDYVAAVREGILYWNKAFGREVLRAEVAPSGVTAPDSRYNIVQWVPWDRAGFAYADALSDPRTGEIKNAQIYLTSVFAFGGKKRVRELLRNLQNPVGLAQQQKIALPRLLTPQKLCDLDVTQSLFKELEAMAATDADEAAILRLAQDYVRIVVAHEVGHTLGLRHNFLGHAALNVPLKQRDEAFMNYLRTGQNPDPALVTTSSVMDYLIFRDDVLAAAQFQQRPQAFSYDDLAIRWGYADATGVNLDRTTGPLFCTDTHVDGGKFADCSRFASSPKPLADNAWNIQDLLESLPEHITETYIAAKTPLDLRDAIPLAEVKFNPAFYAKRVAAYVAFQLQWLNQKTRAATIEHRHPHVGQLNEQEIRAEVWTWVKGQIEELGGVDEVFFSLLPIQLEKQKWRVPQVAADAQKRLEALLTKLQTEGFMDVDGRRHQFESAELALIRAQGEKFFKKTEEKLVEFLLDSILNTKIDMEHEVHEGVLPKGNLSAKLEGRLKEVADYLIFTEKDATVIRAQTTLNGFKPVIQVPQFKYPFSVRQKAARMLSMSLGAGADWSLQSRRELVKKLKEQIENALGRKLSDINLAHFERPLTTWVSEQTELMSLLSKEPGCADLLKDEEKKSPPASNGGGGKHTLE